MLAPGNARLLKDYGQFAVLVGQSEAGLAAARRSIVLDPLNGGNHQWLGQSLVLVRRYNEALVALNEAQTLDPNGTDAALWMERLLLSGNFQNARTACERVDEPWKYPCLAVAYEKLGRHADAEVMLAKFQASSWGTAHPVLSAQIFAQWGDTARALDWLETAMHHHDTYISYVKTFPLLDPLRKEPRFQAIERALKFPS